MLLAIEAISWPIETWIAVIVFAISSLGFAFKMGSRLTAIETSIANFATQLTGVQKTSGDTSASVQQIAITLQAHESRLTAVEREQDRRWAIQHPRNTNE